MNKSKEHTFCEEHGYANRNICKKCLRRKVNPNIIENGRYLL